MWGHSLVGRRRRRLAGLAFSVGIDEATGEVHLGFVAETAKAPTLIDHALPGMLAAGWLEELQVGNKRRLLLGYIQIAGPVATAAGGTGRPTAAHATLLTVSP